MHRRMILAAAAALALALGALPALAQSCAQPANAAQLRAQLLTQVNQQRARQGLAALTENARLQQAAQLVSCDNAHRNQMSHTTADGSTLGTRLRSVGYRFRSANENITMGPTSASGAVSGWMASGVHRANILAASSRHFGGAIAQASGGRWYWTMVTAQPR